MTPAIPWISTAQMREVDRLMIEEVGIDLVRMMENAGRALAQLARRRFLDGDPRGKRVAVLCGSGGNGGGGLVAARRLHGWGATVTIMLARAADAFTGVPGEQLAIDRRLGMPIAHADAFADADEIAALPDAELLLDAVIGYSLQGAPRGGAAALLELANAHPAPVLALDTPSGVDASTGLTPGAAIRAAATMTLALPKSGLQPAMAAGLVGELYLADIGVPPSLYRAPTLGLDVGPLFARDEILRIA